MRMKLTKPDETTPKYSLCYRNEPLLGHKANDHNQNGERKSLLTFL